MTKKSTKSPTLRTADSLKPEAVQTITVDAFEGRCKATLFVLLEGHYEISLAALKKQEEFLKWYDDHLDNFSDDDEDFINKSVTDINVARSKALSIIHLRINKVRELLTIVKPDVPNYMIELTHGSLLDPQLVEMEVDKLRRQMVELDKAYDSIIKVMS